MHSLTYPMQNSRFWAGNLENERFRELRFFESEILEKLTGVIP